VKKLSIIIVNYNVCYFLEQTLISLKKGVKGIDAEIIVVDNHSIDASVEMVRTKFPEVTLIANKNNVGFSKANNQAIKIAKGEYILLLNPDTVVEEDTLTKVCRFMDEHPDAGGVGVKMVDGKGNFLPESKRGLPTPLVAFYKIFGLASLFPNSKIFSRYHLGYLDKDKIHQVDILSGACMFLRKTVLDKTGLLDEDYFMYGEDIDLSYRIVKAGYKNYYFPEARIIHYKGESTKKTSVNYVFVFYKAMIIFARKHFTSQNAGIFSFLINLAIYLRASIALASRILRKAMFPLLDATVIYTGMYFLKSYWEENFKWVPGKYPPEYMYAAVPAYIMIWLSSVYFSGGYDKPLRLSRIITGIFFGTILISALSNFVDAYRFSKALIILGGVFSAAALTFNRYLIHFFRFRNFNLDRGKRKRIILVGNDEEASRVSKMMYNMNHSGDVIGFVDIKPGSSSLTRLGNIEHLKEILEIYKADEVIFCSKDIPAAEIIGWMTKIDNPYLEFRIVPDESNFIIGSNSKDSRGDFYTLNIELNITQLNNLRRKRLLDINLSLIFFFTYPFIFWSVKNPGIFLKNIFRVLSGKNTWVGFSEGEQIHLTQIKKGIISPVTLFADKNLDQATIRRLNLLYAKDYSTYTDLELILKNWQKIGG
jgi:GT2 family glycosyltransferase